MTFRLSFIRPSSRDILIRSARPQSQWSTLHEYWRPVTPTASSEQRLDPYYTQHCSLPKLHCLSLSAKPSARPRTLEADFVCLSLLLKKHDALFCPLFILPSCRLVSLILACLADRSRSFHSRTVQDKAPSPVAQSCCASAEAHIESCFDLTSRPSAYKMA